MTAARKTLDECARYAHAMEPYIDGELDPDHVMDVEGHVRACAPCSERVALARATRQSLKRCVSTHASAASNALRARVCGSILQEKARHEARAAEAREVELGPRLIRLRYAVGLAAAAGVVFAMGAARLRYQPASAPLAMQDQVAPPASVNMGVDTLLEDLVALHAHPLPPEMTDPEQLERFDGLVGVPVRRPAFQPFNASFKGARVHAMRDRRAALLQYTVEGGHRVTVYVFDPRVVPVRGSSLRARVVREQPVYVGRLRGYSVAAAEQAGVGYALASDLDDDESTKLVLAAAH